MSGTPPAGQTPSFEDDADPFGPEPAFPGFAPAPQAAKTFTDSATAGSSESALDSQESIAAPTAADPPKWATEPLLEPAEPKPHPKGNGAAGEPVRKPQTASQQPDYLNWAELQDQIPPPRQWAIPGWIGMGHATLLVGPGATGKTLLIQQIASCLSLGRAFVGEPPERELKCLMWACEDEHDELWRRQLAIARWLKNGLDDFQGRLWIEPRFGKDNTLFGRNGYEVGWNPQLLNELQEQSNDTHADLIILDNVAQLYGANENSRHEVTKFINGLCGALFGKSIILLAHPSKSAASEYSGNTAWENCVRTRLYLGPDMPDKPQQDQDETDANVRYFAKRKTNYSQQDYRILRFTDGLLLPDAVEQHGGLIDHIRKEKAERVILESVQTLYVRQIRTQPQPRSPDHLIKKMAEASMLQGVNKRELSTALARLLVAGSIVEVPTTPGSDRHPRTTLALK